MFVALVFPIRAGDLIVDGNLNVLSNSTVSCGLQVSSNAVFRSSVLTQGSVGISTNAPSARLHVNGDARFEGPVLIRRLVPQGDLSMGSYTNAPPAP